MQPVVRNAYPLDDAIDAKREVTNWEHPPSEASSPPVAGSCAIYDADEASATRPLEGKVLVLVRASSAARVPAYAALREAGAVVVLVHPVRISEFAAVVDRWVLADTNDPEVVETAVRAELSAMGLLMPDAVFSFDEYGVFPAAAVADRLGLRCVPMRPEGLRATSMKAELRSWCVAHGVSSPRHCVLRSPVDDVAALVAETGVAFPVVVKPSLGAGSILVQRFDTLADLEAHAREVFTAVAASDSKHWKAMSAGAGVQLLVEEFIGGSEVDIDAVVHSGKVIYAAISDNFASVPPYFAEKGGLMPSALAAGAQHSLRELLTQFVRSHGRGISGVLHFEAKFDPARGAAYVIEVNCRMGSAETYTMNKAVYGVDLAVEKARLAVGLPPSPGVAGCHLRAPLVHAASTNVYVASEGPMTCQHTPSAEEALVALSVQPKPGQELLLPPRSFACAAWAVARGDTSKEALAAIRRIEASMRVCTNHCTLSDAPH